MAWTTNRGRLIGAALLNWYDPLMNMIGEPALHRRDVLYELGIMLDEGME